MTLDAKMYLLNMRQTTGTIRPIDVNFFADIYSPYKKTADLYINAKIACNFFSLQNLSNSLMCPKCDKHHKCGVVLLYLHTYLAVRERGGIYCIQY